MTTWRRIEQDKQSFLNLMNLRTVCDVILGDEVKDHFFQECFVVFPLNVATVPA
jgi:hypothetical protein